MRRLQALGTAVALLVGIGSGPAMAQSTNASGYVFGVRGHWAADNPYVPELQLGQPVRAGQVIRLVENTGQCFIHIGYLDKSAALLDCEKNPKSCQSPLTVKALAADTTLMDRLGAAWNHLFAQGPVPVVFAISRGVQTEGPREAILSLDRDHIDAAPALHDLEPGDYTLTFRAMPNGDLPIPLHCNWKPPEAQCSSASRLTAGLFSVAVSSAGGLAGSPVAVLLVPPAHFDALTHAFEEWKAITQSWPKETRPETVHYFRTAALDALNQTGRLP